MPNLAKKTTMSKAERLTIAHNALNKAVAPKVQYFLEDFDVHAGGKVSVIYIDKAKLDTAAESDWNEGTITSAKLEAFVLSHYRDVVDTVNHEGAHDQFELDTNVTIYLLENLREVLTDYLNAGKEVLPC